MYRAADLLMALHNRHTLDEYQLSPSGRQILAVVEGAGEPLEPSVIAERLLITTGSVTSLLDNLEKRGLIRRLPHPEDRRKLLVEITPAAQAIVDELLPSLHAREREVISAALSTERTTRTAPTHRESPTRRPRRAIDSGPEAGESVGERHARKERRNDPTRR